MLRSACRLFAGALCCLVIAGAALAADPIGRVVALSAATSASGPGGSRELAAGAAIYEDDRITTGGGNVQIVFRDSTRLLIGPRSSLVIDRFLLRGGRNVRKFSIDVLRGTFRFISGSSRKSAYNITTANSTIRLEGTAFDVSAGGATLIAVYSGRARLCAYGRCEAVDQYCGVARARDGGIMPLKGQGKARALRSLPYVASQAGLAEPFRVDTSGCRPVIGDDDAHRRTKQDRQGEKPTRGRPSAAPGPTPQ